MYVDAAKEGGVLTFLSLNTYFLEYEITVDKFFNKVRNMV